ncbi:MAG: transporter permease [Paenibacillus sp.]|nr:transporter permease [Paenibacillus sp.]
MGVFFRKDFLTYWRDRKEILIALVMPLILIAVLSLAMPDWFGQGADSLRIKIGLVVEDDAAEGVSAFVRSLEQTGKSEEEVVRLAAAAESLNPAALLQEMLEGEALGSLVEVVRADADSAFRKLEEEEWTAVVTIPAGYTESSLRAMMLGADEAVPLSITSDEASMELDVLYGALSDFTRSLNFGSAIESAAMDAGVAFEKSIPPGGRFGGAAVMNGGIEQVEGFDAMTASQYFTLSISGLFSLFMAMTTATKAMTEKRELVFSRILLAGVKPGRYLAGKTLSTFSLTLLQATLAFLVCHFLLDLFPGRDVRFWLGIAGLVAAYCAVVSALAAIFTSLVFRLKEDTAGGLMMAVIMVFGTIGGSFVPVYVLPGWLRGMGEWTPNGLSLAAYTEWIQRGEYGDLFAAFAQLLLFAAAALLIGIAMFPRKGRI